MGLKNYHTHTYRCYHAVGNEEDYIISAINAGFEEIGISDHTPWSYDSNYASHMRMPHSSLEDYINTLNELRNKYKDKISIKIGLECEYFEKYIPKLKEDIKKYNIDYIILGNHFKDSDEYNVYFGYPLNHSLLKSYVDHCIKAIDSNLYSYIAHPDLANYDTKTKEYKEEMTRLCMYAKEHNMPLEFNLLGYKEHRHYPCDDFWKIASTCNNDVIIGFDAHDPKRLNDRELFDKAYNYLNSLNLNIIDKIKFLNK